MKKKMKLLCMTLSAAAILTSCLSEEHEFGKPSVKEEATGTLMLSLNAKTAFNEKTRAVVESDYENGSNYNIEILYKDKEEDKVIKINGSEAGTWQKKLPIGTCTVKAYYGEEVAASRNMFYMYGKKSVTIEPDGHHSVTVDCYPTCAKLQVEFDNEMSKYFKDYYVEFSGTEKLGSGKFSWLANDTEPYYVALKEGEGGEEITFTVNMTTKDTYDLKDTRNKKGTHTGKFTLKRKDWYKMKVKPNYNNPEGSLSIEIEIDDKTTDKGVTYPVPVDWIL